ncbi:helix-turn-helix domain-containing protein [Halobacillus sp. Marseille-Q1614]|uniref:helix-turn-helix domain-containing protein n=1 Tax=Halobacillus sp. Marseille-Q1614 TaxID=2709134 RepID=UPI00157123CA|nr:helix-turn-helix domain-containing protein [Halobacillus sp. Marseille-Q1614]
MKKSKADLIMHPVRMRIIQCLAKDSATVYELLEMIEDVPQATLYRHLNELKKGKVIKVDTERKVRGTVERTYMLEKDGAWITADEAVQMSNDEHLQMFMTFFVNLLRETENYFDGEVDLTKDIYGFSQVDLHLTSDEWTEMRQDIKTLMIKYGSKKKRENTRRVTMAQVFIPEARTKGED